MTTFVAKYQPRAWPASTLRGRRRWGADGRGWDARRLAGRLKAADRQGTSSAYHCCLSSAASHW